MNRNTKVLIQLSEHLDLLIQLLQVNYEKIRKIPLMNTSPFVKHHTRCQGIYTFSVVKTVHIYSVHL